MSGALIGLGEIEDQLGQAEPARSSGSRRPSSSIRKRPKPTSRAGGSSRRPAGPTKRLAAYFRTLELDPSMAPVILRIATPSTWSSRTPEQARERGSIRSSN